MKLNVGKAFSSMCFRIFPICSSRMKITDTKASFKCELGFPEVSVAGMSLKSEFCGFQKIDENIYSLPGQ